MTTFLKVTAIHFLVHQALCFEGSGHSAASPKDDPNRTEVAYTFVAPLLDLCMTSTLSQYMEIMHGWNLRLWSDEIHEGLSVHARNENSLVVSTINKELGHYNQHEENIFVIDNLLFNNCIVGLSPSFPAIHNLNNRTPLEQAITLTLMSKKADALNNEAYAE